VCHSLRGLDAADVVYILPMQEEWMEGSLVPSVHEYPARFQIHRGTLAPNQLLMHPGPVNRGVEVAGDVVDSPQSLIVQQVEAAIIVRMAVLYGAVFDPGSRSGAQGRSTI
jgi:aspartate carbamoyltransferase catalytic subunit